jgi:predicted PurR-regulated permease PerM
MNVAETEDPPGQAPPDTTALGPARARAGWAILVLGIAIVAALLPFAVGLFGAAVLYVVCAPVHRALAPRLGARWAAALVLVGTLLLILVPGAMLVTVAMDQASGVLRGMPASPVFERLAQLRIGSIDVGAQIMAASGTMLSWVSQQAFIVFGGLARTIINLVIAFFGLYYLLVARPGTWERVRGYLPFSPENSDLLLARFHNVTEATLLGIALTALLQGSLIGVTFRLLGLPNALFWGILTGLVSVLPVLGSAIVWLPGVLVLAFAGRFGAAIGLALVGGVVASNLDNLVRLVVFKRVSDIHPMITLVGAFAGVKYMGLIGVLLGPLAITYFFELLRVYQNEHGHSMVRQGSATL